MVDFLEIVRAQNLLDEHKLTAVAASAAEGVDVLEALQAHGIDASMLKEAGAQYFGIPAGSYDKERGEIDQKVLEYIPEDSARHYHMVPLREVDGVIEVGVTDPDDFALRDALNFISGKHNSPYKLVFLLAEELTDALMAYENLSGEVDEALTSIELELNKANQANADGDLTEADREDIKEDAPVTKIVATVLRYAVDGNASDIHIEPTEEKVRVRFRVDGVLATSLELPKDVQYAVAARVKILASLRLDEKRKPQDGRFSARVDGRKIDFRVSVLPTNHGEKVVMRILDTDSGVRGIADTGVSDYALEAIRKAVNLPYGIILISGPTGSGKSTTLYAMLGEVDRLGKNVLSLEDPVEYNIEGVSQSQVRPEIGYTFAHGLRAALRQDPDIIMVGEIRDKETAQLAIQAALTGHLVLSTIHTNNAIGVIPRLIDMGVDPYLIAPTLKLAIAQRLSRRLCENTGRKEEVGDALKQMFDDAFDGLPAEYRDRIPAYDSVLHPEPSPGCASGTRGRIAVMETLEVNSEIESLILNNGSEEEIYTAARKHGFMSMKEDAVIKALSHTIPYEEVTNFSTSLLADEEPEEAENNKVSIEVGESSVSEVPTDQVLTVDNQGRVSG